MLATKTHLYGEVHIGPSTVYVEASAYELADWASRPGYHWPNSDLAGLDFIQAIFDASGLVGLKPAPDLANVPADEFSAWAADVLGDVLPEDHPAWSATVGQFRADV